MLDPNGRFHIPPKKRLKDPEDVLSSRARRGYSGRNASRVKRGAASSEGRARRQAAVKRRHMDDAYDAYMSQSETSTHENISDVKFNVPTDDGVATSLRGTKRAKIQTRWDTSIYGDTQEPHDPDYNAYEELHEQMPSERESITGLKHSGTSGVTPAPCQSSLYRQSGSSQPLRESVDIMALLLNEGECASSLDDVCGRDQRELVRQVATATLAKNALSTQDRPARCSIVLKSASKLYNSVTTIESKASHGSAATVPNESTPHMEFNNDSTSDITKSNKATTVASPAHVDVPACKELMAGMKREQYPAISSKASSAIEKPHKIESQQRVHPSVNKCNAKPWESQPRDEKGFFVKRKTSISCTSVDGISQSTAASALDTISRSKKGVAKARLRYKVDDTDVKTGGISDDTSLQGDVASSALYGDKGRNRSSWRGNTSDKEVSIGKDCRTSVTPWVPERDLFLSTLIQLKYYRLNTPIPDKLLDPIIDPLSDYGEIIMTGSLDEYQFDPECCDSDASDIEEAREQLGVAGTAFLWKCHLSYNAQGAPCWCCCYFDFFGSFVQKVFPLDVFDFEMAHEMAHRCRQNAEVVFHMLWIQNNRGSLDCIIPQDVTYAIVDRFVQLNHILMRVDGFSPLAGQIGELVKSCTA